MPWRPPKRSKATAFEKIYIVILNFINIKKKKNFFWTEAMWLTAILKYFQLNTPLEEKN